MFTPCEIKERNALIFRKNGQLRLVKGDSVR